MRRRAFRIVALTGWLLWVPTGAIANEVSVEAGRRVYEREGCRMCHAIAGEGNRRNPLDGVGSRLKPPDIRRWIVAPREMQPGVKKKAYTLPEEDLARLVEYLESLREP
jgi:cytochrome c2